MPFETDVDIRHLFHSKEPLSRSQIWCHLSPKLLMVVLSVHWWLGKWPVCLRYAHTSSNVLRSGRRCRTEYIIHGNDNRIVKIFGRPEFVKSTCQNTDQQTLGWYHWDQHFNELNSGTLVDAISNSMNPTNAVWIEWIGERAIRLNQIM